VSSPLERSLSDLRDAYMSVPAGQPSQEQVDAALPRLLEATHRVLVEANLWCEVCGKAHHTNSEVAQDDLAEVLQVLGLGDHARPISPHAVVQTEVLPAIRRLVQP
jgi:hypothetical protein